MARELLTVKQLESYKGDGVLRDGNGLMLRGSRWVLRVRDPLCVRDQSRTLVAQHESRDLEYVVTKPMFSVIVSSKVQLPSLFGWSIHR